MQLTEFLPGEIFDSKQEELLDRNAIRVTKSLATLRKVDRLFKRVTVQKEHLSTPLVDLYRQSFKVVGEE